MSYTFTMECAHHPLVWYTDEKFYYDEHEDFHSVSWIEYRLLTAIAAFVTNYIYSHICVRSIRMRFTLSQKCAQTAWTAQPLCIYNLYVMWSRQSFCIIHCLLFFSLLVVVFIALLPFRFSLISSIKYNIAMFIL